MKTHKITVMLVDDEPAILSAVRRALARGGPALGLSMRILPFSSAAAALGTLLTEAVDVVISDYRMPDMDGVEFLRRVRELQPFSGRVLLSGATDFSFLLRAVNQAAVSRVLVKPWAEVDLLSAVRDSVEMRRLLLENAELADMVRVQRGQLSQQQAALRRVASLHPDITEVVWPDEADARASLSDVIESGLATLAPSAGAEPGACARS